MTPLPRVSLVAIRMLLPQLPSMSYYLLPKHRQAGPKRLPAIYGQPKPSGNNRASRAAHELDWKEHPGLHGAVVAPTHDVSHLKVHELAPGTGEPSEKTSSTTSEIENFQHGPTQQRLKNEKERAFSQDNEDLHETFKHGRCEATTCQRVHMQLI